VTRDADRLRGDAELPETASLALGWRSADADRPRGDAELPETASLALGWRSAGARLALG
jgi:hypothetical protein